MARHEERTEVETYPVRVAARLTGLKPELIRAWESRYGAIRPRRTPGGSRRYSDADLHRLGVLRDVVDSGHRIGAVAKLDLATLEGMLGKEQDSSSSATEQLISFAEKFDANGMRQQLSEGIESLGAAEFAKSIALPLLVEIGERWHRGELSIAVEHFATGVIRACLIPALDALEAAPGAPRIVFATPSGEPHDLGSLVAALVAARAGAEVVFLGGDVPVEDLLHSVSRSRAAALVLGFVTLPQDESERAIQRVRAGLPKDVDLWIGGAGIRGIAPVRNTLRVVSVDQVEAQVALLVGFVRDHGPSQEKRQIG